MSRLTSLLVSLLSTRRGIKCDAFPGSITSKCACVRGSMRSSCVAVFSHCVCGCPALKDQPVTSLWCGCLAAKG